jgi:signal transduction histidine kinase
VVERMRRRPEPPLTPPAGTPPVPGRFFSGAPWRPYLLVADNPMPYWVVLRIPFRDRTTGRFTRLTLLLASSSLLRNSFFFEWKPWAAITGIALFVSILCWMPLVRGLTHTIRQMMHATSQVAEGHFDVQVVSNRRDELGSLGASINRMASRLASYVHGQKRFLADIAHELRSPLARMQVALGILERRAGEESGTYVADLQEEVQTMSRLTDELLAYAKATTRPDVVHLEPVNVAGVVREAVRVEAPEGREVVTDLDSSLTVMATKEYLFRSVSNLIRNALRYAGEAGPIRISGRRHGHEVVLSVADSGPGVPEEALEKIFTPFYRLEASRDRKSGGTGLGLAIVGSCAEICGGSVVARNLKPSGLEVTLRLPAA